MWAATNSSQAAFGRTVSGLVLTLANDGRRTAALHEVSRAGPFTLGDVFDHRVALALEAATPADAERWTRWLGEVPGVLNVDIAFVHLAPAVEEAARDH